MNKILRKNPKYHLTFCPISAIILKLPKTAGGTPSVSPAEVRLKQFFACLSVFWQEDIFIFGGENYAQR